MILDSPDCLAGIYFDVPEIREYRKSAAIIIRAESPVYY
jgi:hypothetical protein